MEGYLRHIQACNPVIPETLVPWRIGTSVVGWLRPAVAERLRGFGQIFAHQQQGLTLLGDAGDFDYLSRRLDEVVHAWVAEGFLAQYLGEPYPVTPNRREDALCVVDRPSAGLFGIRSFGQHLNGYVRKRDGLHMWIAKRAMDRHTYPGKLDNLVAGGLPYGLSLAENLRKECEEEAGIAADLVDQAVPVGALTYNRFNAQGLKPDVLYCYDLELPADFQPENTDGEVASFELLPVEEVARLVRETDAFKLNCNLVVIDFLLRHGVLRPEHGDYLALIVGLHPPLRPTQVS